MEPSCEVYDVDLKRTEHSYDVYYIGFMHTEIVCPKNELRFHGHEKPATERPKGVDRNACVWEQRDS